ncbi:energy transducer TonB [Zunongwangia sp.]|uniref:energy transducer TonB n=1 Tax=Zunongwangia sp. TaxID=1965325 RepID=UPI003AA7D25B
MKLPSILIKNLMFISCFLTTINNYGQENVKVEGNSITISEVAPVWPGCEEEANKIDCFNKNFLNHVKTKYKYPRKNSGDFIRGKAVIKMHIDTTGVARIDGISTKEPKIKEALTNMLVKLPKMTPGKKAGKPVSIKYTIPLNL